MKFLYFEFLKGLTTDQCKWFMLSSFSDAGYKDESRSNDELAEDGWCLPVIDGGAGLPL